MDFNDTRLTKQHIPVILSSFHTAFGNTTGSLFPVASSLGSQMSILQTTLPFVWSSLPVKSPSGSLRLQSYLKTL